ncbi:MAG: NigD-like N-terminal domain-containing protein [Bacteroidales bacterium]|nr:NigD-like N-terminal domain-containing protein [Bacteroidales bacterium]
MNATTQKKMRCSFACPLVAFAMAFCFLLGQACDGIDDDMIPEGGMTNAVDIKGASPETIVTVRTSSSGRCYFQLDQDVTLDPKGWTNPYTKEVRAILSFSELKEKSDFCTKSVRVDQIDSLPTVQAYYISMDDGLEGGSDYPVFSVDLGFETTSEMLAASNPVDIVSNDDVPDWMTFSEDGYLMIHFATFWGDVTPHTVNLYASRYHPDHLYLVHNDNGDIQKDWRESYAAFKIAHIYPSRKDGYDNPDSIVLHWLSFNGEKTIKLKYRQRAVEK